jgi:tryptophanyl-tRNA synthetase
MSKTVANSFINLTDSLEQIKKKIAGVPTASVSGGELTPGLKALFAFTKLFLPAKYDDYKKRFDTKTLMFSELKNDLAEAIYAELKPFQERRIKIAANQEYVDEVIADGAKRARATARQTVAEVKNKMGLG